MFPTYHRQSRFLGWWVAVLALTATCLLTWAAWTATYTAFPLILPAIVVLVAVLVFTSARPVVLPEGNVVFTAHVGHIPAVLVCGWPYGPLIVGVVRAGVEMFGAWRHQKPNTPDYVFPGFRIADTTIAILTTSAATVLVVTQTVSPLTAAALLFLIEDLLSFHTMALSGWQASWKEGGVLERWKNALTMQWVPVLPFYPAILATGILLSAGIAAEHWVIVALTSAAATTLPLLLSQRSFLLAEQAENAMKAVNAMEARDKYTRGHTVRVTTVTIKILRELRVPFKYRLEAALVGPIHDIGKVTTSDKVLNKRGWLEPCERPEMEAHIWDNITDDKRWHWLLTRYPKLKWLVELIAPGTWVAFVRRCHHLEYAGTGYPKELQRHLVGELIPLVALAMAVADVWDAMTSDRPYRKGMPVDEAIAALTKADDKRKTYGGQLATRCVDALVRLVEQGEVVANDTSLEEFQRIRDRFGSRQPDSKTNRLYLLAISAGGGLTWLTIGMGPLAWWSILLTAQVAWALWANFSITHSSHELLRRLAVEAERRSGYAEAETLQREREDLAAWLARASGLSRSEVRRIREAACLMNLGNLIVSDSDWKSPEPLSDEVQVMVRQHPAESAKLAPPELAELILQHHERYDGSGYPHGLKGEQICLGARILRLVEAWAALRADRPHRPALTPAAALAELERDAGAYDHNLLRLLKKSVGGTN